MKAPAPREQSLSEVREELETYMTMFATDGWQNFMKATAEQQKADLANVHNSHPSNDQWQQFRGHTMLVNNLLGFEDLIKRQIEELDAYEEEARLEAEDSLDGEEITL